MKSFGIGLELRHHAFAPAFPLRQLLAIGDAVLPHHQDMQIRPLFHQKGGGAHEFGKAAVRFHPAGGIGKNFPGMAEVQIADFRGRIRVRPEIIRIHPVMKDRQLRVKNGGNLRELKPRRHLPPVAGRHVHQQRHVLAMDTGGVVMADGGRIEEVGIGPAGVIIPFEIAEQPRLGEDFLHIEAVSPSGMGADDIRHKSFLFEIEAGAKDGLTVENGRFHGTKIMMGFRLGVPMRLVENIPNAGNGRRRPVRGEHHAV